MKLANVGDIVFSCISQICFIALLRNLYFVFQILSPFISRFIGMLSVNSCPVPNPCGIFMSGP